VLTTLNVDPGGYCPSIARLSPDDGELATASTAPVRTSTAASAASTGEPASAASAACCTFGSTVRVSDCPGTASVLNSGAAAVPDAGTSLTRTPATPPSRSSYWRCSPEVPATSPATKRPLPAVTCSAVTGPTDPSSARAKSRVGASAWVRSRKTTPGSGFSLLLSGS